ncbi:MAG TPA: hypothetical protein VMP89_17790 [Solirubrobacteraceae bacterium]|nr:hypothetical protein [Solirubrobacteraceae bacterium]
MRRARGLRGSIALALVTVAAVGGVTLGTPAGTHGAVLSVPLTAGPLPSAGCSWFGETDQRDVNIGAPDLDAFYWLSPLTPSLGARDVITGSYPHARYFSFHVYDNQGNALGSIYDQQIAPDRGSANPFRGRVRRGRGDRFTAYVSFEPRPSRPAPDTVYVSPAAAGDAALLVYRVYVPAHPTVPSGDVPFPQVRQETGSGQTLTALGACATTPPPFGSVFWQAAASEDYPAGAPVPANGAATRIPTWQRSFGNQLGNQQNAYLVTTLSRQYGDLVVLHARAPTFPNSRAGQPVYGRHQLRYWSLCTYDASGQAGFGCAADYVAPIRSGSITYVVSDPGTRPANATAAHGVAWLPWGAQPAVQLVYRNMLPATWFAHAVQRVKPSSSVPKVLGAYYPSAVYCAPATFGRGGWRACFAAAGLRTGRS